MSPELILFAIKAAIRIGQQTDKALIDRGVDLDAIFPNAQRFTLQPDQELALNEFLAGPGSDLQGREPFKPIWDVIHQRIIHAQWVGLSQQRKDEIYNVALAFAQHDNAALALFVTGIAQGAPIDPKAVGFILVSQWNDNTKPIPPIGRIALTIADIALEYVQIDPSIIGVRGTAGQKILKSFADAIGAPLSKELDADQLGTAAQFHDDLLSALLSAALDTFKSNLNNVVSDEHLAALVKNALEPVVTVAKTPDVTFQRRLQLVFDALAGPAAAAAFKTVSKNPSAFFGQGFDQSKAAGALVSALLVQAAKGDLRTLFTDQGLIGLLNATLDVAAQHPELLIHIDNQAKASLTQDVIGSLAGAIKQEVTALPSTKLFEPRRVAGELAAAAIEAVGRHADAITTIVGKPWHNVTTDLVKQVLSGLGVALNDPDQGQAMRKLFSEQQLIDLGRIVIRDAAATPTWVGADARMQAVVQLLGTVLSGDTKSVLSGTDITTVTQTLLSELSGNAKLFSGLQPEIAIAVKAVIAAMGKDNNVLLSGADWTEILKVAVAEASANPARLFGLSNNDDTQMLAANVIGLVIKNVPAAVTGGTPALLKGNVLRDATIILISYLAGHSDAARKYYPLVTAAVKKATDIVTTNPGRYGSKEWLRLVRVLTAKIVAGEFDAQFVALQSGQQLTLLDSFNDVDQLLAGSA